MPRLIDADAFRKEMQEYVFPITTNNLMGAADAYHRILHLLDDAPTIDPAPQWIPVTERPPEENGMYIVCCDDSWCPADEGIWYQEDVVVEAEYYNGSWTWYEGGTEWSLEKIVTHWMPLPKPPEDGGAE